MDEVGGLARATEVAKQLAGLPLEPEATITAEWPPRWEQWCLCMLKRQLECAVACSCSDRVEM